METTSDLFHELRSERKGIRGEYVDRGHSLDELRKAQGWAKKAEPLEEDDPDAPLPLWYVLAEANSDHAKLVKARTRMEDQLKKAEPDRFPKEYRDTQETIQWNAAALRRQGALCDELQEKLVKAWREKQKSALSGADGPAATFPPT